MAGRAHPDRVEQTVNLSTRAPPFPLPVVEVSVEGGDLEPLAAPYAHHSFPCSGPGQVVAHLKGGGRGKDEGGAKYIQAGPLPPPCLPTASPSVPPARISCKVGPAWAIIPPPTFPLPPPSFPRALTSCSSLTSSRAAMKPG